ncbi:MAG: HesA/MoeB/ThiF family protein [Candidatus Altiarchaeota archaeon]|nr:HesA/MoeB/ThiF family protein [Candidatus Altiarchaeota archaeon]
MRYIRQDGLVNQEKLKNSKILVAGLGGLGQPVATYLALSGVGTLYLLDDDKIEESNLNRQFLFTEKDIGKLKIDIVEKKINEINPDVNLIKISELSDDVKLDLVMDCFDNWPSRYELWNFAFNNLVPVIHGAADEFGGQIAVMFNQGDASPLMGKSESSCEVLGATTGLIGSKMAIEAIKLLMGNKTSKMITYDGTFNEFPIKPGKTPVLKDFSKHEVIRVWTDSLKMEKGKKYLIICKGGLKGAKMAEEANKNGFDAVSMSYRAAKKLKLL